VQPVMQGSAGEQMVSAGSPQAGSGVGATTHAAPPPAPQTGAGEPTVAGGVVTGVATAVGVAAGAVAGVAGVAASAVSSLVGSAPAGDAMDPEPERASPDAQPEGMSLGPEPVDNSPPAAQLPVLASLGPSTSLAGGSDAISVPADPSEAQAAVPASPQPPLAPVVAGKAEYPAEPQQSSVQAAAVSAVDGGMGATTHAAPPPAPPSGAAEPAVAGGVVTGVATAVGVAGGAVAGVAGVAASALSSLVGSALAGDAMDPEPERASPDAQPEGMSLGPEPVGNSPPAAQLPVMASLGSSTSLAGGSDAISVPADPSETQAAVPASPQPPLAPVVAGKAEYPAEPQQSSVQAAAVSAVNGGMGATTHAAPPPAPPPRAVGAVAGASETESLGGGWTVDGGTSDTTHPAPPLAPPPRAVGAVAGASETESLGGGWTVDDSPAPGASSGAAAFTAAAEAPAEAAPSTETARRAMEPAVVAAPAQTPPVVGSAEVAPADAAMPAPLTATPAVLSTDEALAPTSPVLVSPFAGLASVPVRYSLDESETKSMVAPEVRYLSFSSLEQRRPVLFFEPRPRGNTVVCHTRPRVMSDSCCIHLYAGTAMQGPQADMLIRGLHITDMFARPAQASMQESSVLPPPNTVFQGESEIAPLPPALMPAEAAGVKAPAVERRSNGAAHTNVMPAGARPAAARPAAARAPPPAAQDKVKAKGCFCFA